MDSSQMYPGASGLRAFKYKARLMLSRISRQAKKSKNTQDFIRSVLTLSLKLQILFAMMKGVFALSILLLALLGQAMVLIPYRNRYSDLWDSLLERFRVLKDQIPISLPTDVESAALARIDWKETPAAHIFTVDVPGMKKDEIKIEGEENRVLRISGEHEKEGEKWHRAERAAGNFWREFRLPANVEMDAVTAKWEHGVLTVTVPKIENVKAKTSKTVNIVDFGEL